MGYAFKCDLCSEEFDFVDKLDAHMEREHEEISGRKNKTFKCNICGRKCSSGPNLVCHMRMHTGERPFKCEISDCGHAFKREHHLKTHIKVKHSDERPFKCDFPGCPYTAKTSSTLVHHKKVHNNERPFACPHSECNFRARVNSHLSRHVAHVHSESKTFICSKCDFKTNYSKSLACHIIFHEGINEKIPCSVDGCEYKGKNSRALKDHMRCHNKTLLKCPVSGCGRYGSSKKALEDHVELHSPLGRDFQCPLCFKHFRRLDHLQLHCVAHTNEKPIQCGHCNYATARPFRIKAHISSAHAAIEFPFIVHLLDDRECLRCKVTLPSAQFLHHCNGHVRQL